MKTHGTVMISWDFTHGDEDVGVLLVGERHMNGQTIVVNAFQGKEAKELVEKLTTKKSDA